MFQNVNDEERKTGNDGPHEILNHGMMTRQRNLKQCWTSHDHHFVCMDKFDDIFG